MTPFQNSIALLQESNISLNRCFDSRNLSYFFAREYEEKKDLISKPTLSVVFSANKCDHARCVDVFERVKTFVNVLRLCT